MYGNPRTPLLPHFSNNMWSSNCSTIVRCIGCSSIISEHVPQSPKKQIETRGSYSNLTGPERNNLLTKAQLSSNIKSPKHLSIKHVGISNNGLSNYIIQHFCRRQIKGAFARKDIFKLKCRRTRY